MTIEKHIERIKEKYANDESMMLTKLISLGLQLGLPYGAKQKIIAETDKLWAKGVKPFPWLASKDSKRKIKDSMGVEDLERIVHSTIKYIKAKYPNEHNTQDRWLTLVAEEFGELARAINDGDISNYVEELTQTIAALYLMGLDFCTKQNCAIDFEDIYKKEDIYQ